MKNFIIFAISLLGSIVFFVLNLALSGGWSFTFGILSALSSAFYMAYTADIMSRFKGLKMWCMIIIVLHPGFIFSLIQLYCKDMVTDHQQTVAFCTAWITTFASFIIINLLAYRKGLYDENQTESTVAEKKVEPGIWDGIRLQCLLFGSQLIIPAIVIAIVATYYDPNCMWHKAGNYSVAVTNYTWGPNGISETQKKIDHVIWGEYHLGLSIGAMPIFVFKTADAPDKLQHMECSSAQPL